MAGLKGLLPQKEGADNLGAYQPLPSGAGSSAASGTASKDPEKDEGQNTDQKKDFHRQHTLLERHVQVAETEWQKAMIEFLEGNCVQSLTVIVILANAIFVGLETDLEACWVWDFMETIFLIFFSCELFLRLFAYRMYFIDCMENPDFIWNIIDLTIVSAGLLSSLVVLVESEKSGLSNDATIFRTVRLLRILRILRVVRVFKFLKQLYLLAYGFVEGANAVFWVATLASCIIYVCAIVLVRVYRNEDNEFIQSRFSTIPTTMFTLFEIMSDPSLGRYRDEIFEYPTLTGFIVIYIIFGSFGINGLLTGVISESILEKNQARVEAMRLDRESKRRNLMKDCADLFDKMDDDDVGTVKMEEVIEYDEDIKELFAKSGVSIADYDLGRMLEVMDYDGDGFIEKPEFCHGILELCEEIRPMSIMELHSAVARCNGKITHCSSTIELMMDTVGQSFADLGKEMHQRRSEFNRAKDLMTTVSKVLESKGEQEQGGVQEQLQKAESVIDNLKNIVFDFSKSVMADAAAEADEAIPTFQENAGKAQRKRRKSAIKQNHGHAKAGAAGPSMMSDPLRDQPRMSLEMGPLDISEDWQEAARERADDLLKKVAEMQVPSVPDVASSALNVGGGTSLSAPSREDAASETSDLRSNRSHRSARTISRQSLTRSRELVEEEPKKPEPKRKTTSFQLPGEADTNACANGDDSQTVNIVIEGPAPASPVLQLGEADFNADATTETGALQETSSTVVHQHRLTPLGSLAHTKPDV